MQLPVVTDRSMNGEVDLWKDKYARASTECELMRKRNEELEDRLLHVVDKIESDKQLLSAEIDGSI
jgi:hypothetical protein